MQPEANSICRDRESILLWDSPEPESVPDNESVQFRLLYSGNQIVSNGGPKVKHALRKAFHLQLKQLWSSNPRLLKMASRWGNYKLYGDILSGGEWSAREREPIWSRMPEQMARGRAKFLQIAAERYSRGNFQFIPLVEESLRLRVSLDILFLRRDNYPLVKEGGDIDNRLKTLFDALRVPPTLDGLGGAPEDGETPFFVLLEDDSLISEVRVNTDSLLMLPHQKAPDPKDAFLVLDVKIQPTEDIERSFCFS
jgi:hypothetical protein